MAWRRGGPGGISIGVPNGHRPECPWPNLFRPTAITAMERVR